MNSFLSKGFIVASFFIVSIITYSHLYFKIKDDFFQLKLNWEGEKELQSFKVQNIDSISQGYLQIQIDTSFIPNINHTYKLKTKYWDYYFKSIYTYTTQNTIQFFMVNWLNEMPQKKINCDSLIESDLSVKQDSRVKVMTIGDQLLYVNEARYFRKILAEKTEVSFVGRYKDVYNYPHEAIINNNLNHILKEIDSIESANYYIIFCDSNDLFINHVEMSLKIKQLLEKLNSKKETKKIIFLQIPVFNNSKKDSLRQKYNQILSKQKVFEKVIVINTQKILENNTKDYLLPNGKELNKKGYTILANEIIKYIE